MLGEQGFDVFVKRRGKFFKLRGTFTKQKAKDIGAEAISKSLGATFKLVKSKRSPLKSKSTGEFKRLAKMLRTYKKQKGKKIPLQDVWIQKRKYRLSSVQERKEIKKAKEQFNLLGNARKKVSSNNKVKRSGWL